MVTLTRPRAVSNGDGPRSRLRRDDLSSRAHRQLIGYLGLSLPAALIVIAGLRPIEELPSWTILNSVSAYYYTGAVAAFVGVLVALALFLLTYRGYDNRYRWADLAAARIGGVAALGVALFPAGPPAEALEPLWWRESIGVVHYGCAAVLFASFAVFSLFLFRLTARGDEPSFGKRVRNGIYLSCGVVIVGAMIWAAVAGLMDKPVFLPESMALIAFAVSWLIKGYAHRSIAGAARSIGPAVKSRLRRSGEPPAGE